MDNAMVVAGHGRAVGRRLTARLAAVGAGLSLAFALVMVLFQRAAEAQLPNITGLICGILISLSNAFGGLLAGIFSALLSFFHCGISG